MTSVRSSSFNCWLLMCWFCSSIASMHLLVNSAYFCFRSRQTDELERKSSGTLSVAQRNRVHKIWDSTKNKGTTTHKVPSEVQNRLCLGKGSGVGPHAFDCHDTDTIGHVHCHSNVSCAFRGVVVGANRNGIARKSDVHHFTSFR